MRKIYVLGLISFIAVTGGPADAEQITLSTYYPSPYGVYTQLRLAPSGQPACGAAQEGLIYYDNGINSLRICRESAPAVYQWQGLGGLWSQNGNNIYYNTGYVGIGTDDPQSALQVQGNSDIRGEVSGHLFSSNFSHPSEQMPNVFVRNVNGGQSFMPAGDATRGVWVGVTSDGTEQKYGIDSVVGGGSGDRIAVRGIVRGWGVGGGSGTKYAIYGDSPWGGYDFYAAGAGTDYGPFTGAHEVKLSDDFPNEVKRGMVVSVNGEAQNRECGDGSISISSTLPSVELSRIANDRAVLGAFVFEGSLPSEHWYKVKEGERFGTVNALGEGRVLVTDINGEIQTGDYITTSVVPGYGQKQDDDLLHSYTLGKAIEDVNWDEVDETVSYNGREYKVYLIAVVYTSG